MNMSTSYPFLLNPRDSPPRRWVSFREVRRDQDGRHLVDFPPGLPLIALPYRLDIDHPLTPNFHDYCEVAYIVSGRGGCSLGAGGGALNPGDLVVVGPACMHTFWSDPRDPVRFLALYFLPELVRGPGSPDIDREYLAPFAPGGRILGADAAPGLDRGAVRAQLEELALIYGMRKEDPARNRERELYLATAVRCLLYRLRAACGPAERGYAGRLDRLAPAFALARRSLVDRVELAEAAAACGMSPWHFSRTFKAATGSTFTEYRNRVRVDRAKELLRSTGLPVTRVAGDSGFDSVNYFNRIFRRLVGVAPRAYRELERE